MDVFCFLETVVKGSIYSQAPESLHLSEGVTNLFMSFEKLQFSFQPNELACLWSWATEA